MADRESVLRWLNEKAYRVVTERHPNRRICDRLVSERKAVVLAPNRYAITVRGFDDLCPPGVILERRAMRPSSGGDP